MKSFASTCSAVAAVFAFASILTPFAAVAQTNLGQAPNSPSEPTPVLQAALPGAINGHWTLDAAGSSVTLSTRVLGLTDITGRFDKITGDFNLVARHPEQSTVTLTMEASSLSTNNPRRDTVFQGARFLDAAKYPLVTFKSAGIEPIGGNSYLISGSLSIHGVTQQVMVAATVMGPVKGLTGTPRFGIQILTSVNRQDYGMTWRQSMDTGDTVLSDNIDVVMNLMAVPAGTPVNAR